MLIEIQDYILNVVADKDKDGIANYIICIWRDNFNPLRLCAEPTANSEYFRTIVSTSMMFKFLERSYLSRDRGRAPAMAPVCDETIDAAAAASLLIKLELGDTILSPDGRKIIDTSSPHLDELQVLLNTHVQSSSIVQNIALMKAQEWLVQDKFSDQESVFMGDPEYSQETAKHKQIRHQGGGGERRSETNSCVEKRSRCRGES